jgi:hypothetical protein
MATMTKAQAKLADDALAVLADLDRPLSCMGIAGILRQKGFPCSSSDIYYILSHDQRVIQKDTPYGATFRLLPKDQRGVDTVRIHNHRTGA